MLAQDDLDQLHCLGERGGILDLGLHVDLHLDCVAQVASRIEERLGRHEVGAAAVAHLSRELQVVFPEAVECDNGRCLDAAPDKFHATGRGPGGEVIVGLVPLLRELREQGHATGRRGLFVVLARLVAGDRFCDIIEKVPVVVRELLGGVGEA